MCLAGGIQHVEARIVLFPRDATVTIRIQNFERFSGSGELRSGDEPIVVHVQAIEV
jgi:hypothetical protein